MSVAIAGPLAGDHARHVLLSVADGVAAVTLNRPERKNPLTFESYAELVALFGAARTDATVKAFVLSGAGDNFSSGGDVHDIIGPLIAMPAAELLRFTTMTGDLVKAMRACPQPIVAAVDGICAGAGAIMAMASDLRIGTVEARVAFLFNRVGLAGCDMGACAILPRLIGQGRATVGAAALGLARRALRETLARTTARHLFGAPMAEMPAVRGHLAGMAADVDTAALMVDRAAWAKDAGAPRISREASLAKLVGTEAAGRVIDTAVQLHGGDGVRIGCKVEELYREVRALRIYEGASDVQKLIVARQVVAGHRARNPEPAR